MLISDVEFDLQQRICYVNYTLVDDFTNLCVLIIIFSEKCKKFTELHSGHSNFLEKYNEFPALNSLDSGRSILSIVNFWFHHKWLQIESSK